MTDKQIETRIARVREMESRLDRSEAAIRALDEALTGYENILDESPCA